MGWVILGLALFDLAVLFADVALGLMVWQDRYSRACLRRLDTLAAERRQWRITRSRHLRLG